MNAIRNTRVLANVAAIAFTAALGHAAYALSDTMAASRADVKAQTRAANKAGQLLPAGEMNAADKPLPLASIKTREQRKAETLAANRNGGLGSPGQSLYNVHNVAPREALAHSTKTRAERKSETLEAARANQLMPAGEAYPPSMR
jgi:hypothetical protein